MLEMKVLHSRVGSEASLEMPVKDKNSRLFSIFVIYKDNKVLRIVLN
jgi:hypothetical protein